MTKWLAVLLLATTACDAVDASDGAGLLLLGFGVAGSIADGTSDGSGNGNGSGSGSGGLPKSGADPSDPTIDNATAFCNTTDSSLSIQIEGNDPSGKLSSCTATFGSETEQAAFTNPGVCFVTFPATSCCFVNFSATSCRRGDLYTIDIAISNTTGGVTSTSITRTAL